MDVVYVLVQTRVLVWWWFHLSCDKNGDDQTVNRDNTGHDDGNKRLFFIFPVSVHLLGWAGLLRVCAVCVVMSCLHDQVWPECPYTGDTNPGLCCSICCPQCCITLVSLSCFFTNANRISRSKTYSRKPSSKRNCQLYESSRGLQTGEGRYSLQMQSQPNIMLAKTITNQNPHDICDQDGLTKEKNGANFGANSLSAMMDRQPFNFSHEDFKQGKWLKERTATRA